MQDWQKIQVNWDGHKNWCVVQRKRYLVICWCWDRSDTGFRTLEVESCTGNSDAHGDTSTQARIFCWAMSFCQPWWLPTSQRHIDCIYQLCSGIPWPSSALPTWSQSWCLCLSGTRCAWTEPCCSGTSCPEKTADGNGIVVWKFVQSGFSTNISLNPVSSEPHVSFCDHLNSPVFLSVLQHLFVFPVFFTCFFPLFYFPLFFPTVFFHSFFLVFPTHPHTLSPQSALPHPLPSLFIQGLVSFVLCICLKIGLGRKTFSGKNH